MSGANASPIGRSHQEMPGANASPTRSASATARSLEEGRSHQGMGAELRSLRIDRGTTSSGSKRARRWMLTFIALAILSAAGYAVYARVTSPIEVDVVRVIAPSGQ